MSSPIECVLDALNADEIVTGALGVYDFGDGDAAAIFGRETLPIDKDIPAVFPAILVGFVSSSDESTRGAWGVYQQLGIRIIGTKHSSMKIVRDIAYRASFVLHEEGYTSIGHLTTLDPDNYPMASFSTFVHWFPDAGGT